MAGLQVTNSKKAELAAQAASIRAGVGPQRAVPSVQAHAGRARAELGSKAVGTRGSSGQANNGAAARKAGNTAPTAEQQYNWL